MKRDLFLAILSMDAYNRTYGEHLVGLIDTNGTAIGNAVIQTTSTAKLGDDANASGFYAIAYTAGAGIEGIAAGQTIIAYRGTNPTGGFLLENIRDDIFQGYGIGTGFANGPQARQTIEFAIQ